MNQTLKTQTTCDDIIENTQALIDKDLLLDFGTSVICNKCSKGFVTKLEFESLDGSVSSKKIYCSNALCNENKTITYPIGSSVIESNLMVENY